MAKKYKVVLTSEAADELQKIVEYLEEEVSDQTAVKVRDGLIQTIDSLE